MARKKRQRFQELASFSNVWDRDQAGPGGDWVRRHFGAPRPLLLELGCGKGEYSLALAGLFPDSQVIGLDRRGDRIWVGARRALEKKIDNVAFLRTEIEDLCFYFDPGQVEEIWIPFPDPLPKRRQTKHRLTSPEYLRRYREVLVDSGRIHLKTDDSQLFEFSRQTVEKFGGEILVCREDLDEEDAIPAPLSVRTTFERKHRARNRTIKYLQFRLPGSNPPID